MPRLVRFDVRDLPGIRVVGRAIRPDVLSEENSVPAFRDECLRGGALSALEGMADRVFDPSCVGFICERTEEDGKYTYLCGMLMIGGTPVPEGYAFRDINPCTAAVGWIQGYEKTIYPVAHELTRKELEKQGYQADDAAGWRMELYHCPRFTVPLENGEVILDYYIPCKCDIELETLDAIARA